MDFECIILAGGPLSKPLLKLNKNLTLLDRQIQWLKKYGCTKIILATSKNFIDSAEYVSWHLNHGTEDIYESIETTDLGTAGAAKQAITVPYDNCCWSENPLVYVMNVDVLVNYNPTDLFEAVGTLNGAILISKPPFPYGRISLRNGLIVRFQEKPCLDFYVSVGHYCFKVSEFLRTCPETGDLERTVLPKMAKERKLNALKYKARWFRIKNDEDVLKGVRGEINEL